MGDITQWLTELEHGDNNAVARLLPVVYAELRALAHAQRRSLNGPESHTTSVVHEAYLKLAAQRQIDWQSRAQFFYLAAQVIRSILVDNARRSSARKRGGGAARVTLDPDLLSTTHDEELLSLDAALDQLRQRDERAHAVVVCRFFGGMDVHETASALDCSAATVKRDWQLARTWLFRALSETPRAPS